MKLHCPHCGVKGSAEDSYSGRKIKCPKCQGMFELQPEMALEVTEDAALSQSLSSTQIDPPAAPDEVELPVTEALVDDPPSSELADTVEEEVQDIDLEEPAPGVELVEPDVSEDVIADEEPAAEEEQLDWEDVASEIDLEEADGDLVDDAEEDSPATGELETDPHAFAELGEKLDDEPAPLDLADDFDETALLSPDGDVGLDQELFDHVVEESLEESPAEELFDAEALEQELEELVDDSRDGIDLVEAVESAALAGSTEKDDTVAEELSDESTEQLTEEVAEDLAGEELSEDDDQVELEPYGIDKGECWQCGKKDSGEESFVAKDGRLYCTECFPVETPEESEHLTDTEPQEVEEQGGDDIAVLPVKKFAIGELISTAWAKTKGAKGVIWGGSAIMYLVILIVIAGGAFSLPALNGEQVGAAGPSISVVFELLSTIFSVLFTAGLFYMGIKKVVDEPVSWKMIFKGFSCAGKIIIATILQFILVTIGFVLLFLPGIYLVVGYTMVLPLIVDKGLSPWQALETSRKAVHKVWWRVAGLYLLMGLIVGISCVPLGIGLIWTWPMFIILTGVVYRQLFGAEDEVG